jgi:hypothetical protein
VTGVDALVGLFPPGTSLDADGMLVVGGCRLDALAQEYGTPVLVVVEDSLRERARAYRSAPWRRGGRTRRWSSRPKPSRRRRFSG